MLPLLEGGRSRAHSFGIAPSNLSTGTMRDGSIDAPPSHLGMNVVLLKPCLLTEQEFYRPHRPMCFLQARVCPLPEDPFQIC
jgi:hypothetical protein